MYWHIKDTLYINKDTNNIIHFFFFHIIPIYIIHYIVVHNKIFTSSTSFLNLHTRKKKSIFSHVLACQLLKSLKFYLHNPSRVYML